jgi:hypothetical protein
VDLTWPQQGAEADLAPTPPRVHSTPAAESAVTAATPPAPRVNIDGYREQVEPSVARFEEMTPFLLSAAKSPVPQVLAALSQTLKSLEATLASIAVPRQAADGHSLMTSAVAAARTAMASEFTGDRSAQAQQAVKMFQGGKAALP